MLYKFINFKTEMLQLFINFRFNDSGLNNWDASLSKSIDTTDGISSFYSSLNDQRSAIVEEKQEDFVSYTPLDRGIFIFIILILNKPINFISI